MERDVYKILKRAHKNPVNLQDLKKIKFETVKPIILNRIRYIVRNINYNNQFEKVVAKFSKIENSTSYKDELVITYLLFIGKLLNNITLNHMFFNPQSQQVFDWILLYKRLAYSIVVLLYNKRFKDQDWFHLDDMVRRLNEGYPDAVRTFLKKLGILSIPDVPVEIETKYAELYGIVADEFGQFYWRMLHFMAEAIDMRKTESSSLAKTIWKEFTIFSLYRTLSCSICKEHFKTLCEMFKERLQNDVNYSKLWFDIHTHKNGILQKAPYPYEEFEKDQSIMRNLLTN